MAAPVRSGLRQVKPILSLDHGDARRRTLNLFRAWMRQVPYIVTDYDIPKSERQLKIKIRDEFKKNSNVKDLRIIDMLIVKGQMELKETAQRWKTNTSVMYFFKDTWEPKPKTFLSKFFTGQE